MKTYLLLLFMYLPILMISQDVLSMDAVNQKQELSMSEANGKTTDGVYRYYAVGSKVPYTGVLYANHSNGKLDSWQEFVDGIGQGRWINYYENGNFKEIGHYEQNRVEGAIKKFHPNGVLQAEGTYKDWRIKVGEWKYYNVVGELINIENYGEKGNIKEVESYYSRGEISYSWYSQILSKNGF